jgi:hypothetical protein
LNLKVQVLLERGFCPPCVPMCPHFKFHFSKLSSHGDDIPKENTVISCPHLSPLHANFDCFKKNPIFCLYLYPHAVRRFSPARKKIRRKANIKENQYG